MKNYSLRSFDRSKVKKPVPVFVVGHHSASLRILRSRLNAGISCMVKLPPENWEIVRSYLAAGCPNRSCVLINNASGRSLFIQSRETYLPKALPKYGEGQSVCFVKSEDGNLRNGNFGFGRRASVRPPRFGVVHSLFCSESGWTYGIVSPCGEHVIRESSVRDVKDYSQLQLSL